jgi:hypothetical protein
MIHENENEHTNHDIRVTRLLWFALGFLLAIGIAMVILYTENYEF